MNYWDTSALLKLYVSENDSGHFLDLVVSSGRPIVSSAIAAAEMLCALYRKEWAGDLKSGSALATYQKFLGDCRAGRIVLIPYGEQVFTVAEGIVRLAFRGARPVMVRSLDHVASAVTAQARVMVATDARLRTVAARAKLKLR